MIGRDAVVAVLHALNELEIPYMVTGALATNLYAVPRSTKDADIVICMEGVELNAITSRLPPDIRLDPQMKFETITMTTRFDLLVEGTPFRIELFLLADDPHHQARFERRVKAQVLGTTAWVPTPEDVLIQKVRWSKRGKRTKDIEDARNVIEEQANRLDWPYIEKWCREHGTLDLLQQIRDEAFPPRNRQTPTDPLQPEV